MKKIIILPILFFINLASANMTDFLNKSGKAGMATLVCAISTVSCFIASFKKKREAQELDIISRESVHHDRMRNWQSPHTKDRYAKAKQKRHDSKFYFNLSLLGICCTLTCLGITTYQAFFNNVISKR